MQAPAEALKDLDQYVRDRVDAEGLIWRGEIKRRLGRPLEAMEDLDRALGDGDDLWALINRGLARGALGDQGGLRADFLSLPADIRTFLLRKIGSLPGERRPESFRAALEMGLTLGHGLRRPHSYLFPIWMRD